MAGTSTTIVAAEPRRRLTPISAGRGKFVRYKPLVSDPKNWLENEFDWQSNVSVVDMFSGAGGLSFGLDSVPGMNIVAAFEQDPVACETHSANMAAPVYRGDVARIQNFEAVLQDFGVRRVDVLVGGPPCAGFSRLGKGALRKMALEDGRLVDLGDDRNWLFRHFMRAVREILPQVVVIENVPEMIRYGEIIEEIESVFTDLDYTFDPVVLNAHDHGVPQRRRRLFMVANRHGSGVAWPTCRRRIRTLRDAIGDLPEVPPLHLEEEIVWSRPGRKPPYLKEMRAGLRGKVARVIRDHVTRAQRPEDVEAFRHMKEGDLYGAVPEALRRYRDDIFSDKYNRMIWNEPAWTVTAHIAKDGYKYIHPEQHRTLSVREAARIQSFPDRFCFAGSRTHRFKQIGNAVPPKLAEALGMSLLPLVR